MFESLSPVFSSVLSSFFSPLLSPLLSTLIPNIFDSLLEPLSYQFLLRGLIAGILSATACSLLSNFVVWQGWSFMGDAISHAILPGIVIAYILGFSLILGSFVFAIFAVLFIGFIGNNSILKGDNATGIVYTGFFAFGLLLLNITSSFQDLSHILFGNILGVNVSDLVLLVSVALGIIIIVVACFKEFLTVSFDPAHAFAIGLSAHLIRYVQLILLALTIIITVQSVGIILVIAFLITPASTALLLTRRLGRSFLLSFIFAVAANILGFYIAYYADVALGPVIVLVLFVFFILALVFSRLRRLSTK